MVMAIIISTSALHLSSPKLDGQTQALVSAARILTQPEPQNNVKPTSLLFLPHDIRLCFLDALEFGAAEVCLLLLCTRKGSSGQIRGFDEKKQKADAYLAGFLFLVLLPRFVSLVAAGHVLGRGKDGPEG